VFLARFDALICLIKERASERCAILAFIVVSSEAFTHPYLVQSPEDSTLIVRPETLKRSCNSNNHELTCYALVTHTGSCLVWKCFLKSNLQRFLALWTRSSKRLSLGRQNREFCGKARKSHPSITPKTPKTPVCVTHILRTPAPFPHAGWKVAGQTQKAGVMRVLCTPFHGIWTDLDPGANVWPR
jgi:hypothetical protein